MFGGLLKSTSLAALVAVAGIAVTGTSAQAADLGGNCCADLEERIAELEATTARKGNRKVSLTVSGQVNEAVMFWDDGVESNAYQVTNEVSRTRFRFLGNAKIDGSLSAGYLMEIGVRGSNSGAVSQNADDAGQGLDVRQSVWWLNHKDLGKLWIGQQSTSTDGITEISLASTGHFGGAQYQDYIGGFFFRNNTGALSGFTYSQLTNGNGNVGEGTRFNSVKYDTPTLAGFTGSASWGEDDLAEVALRYAGEFNGIKLAAGIGYAQWTDGNPTGAPERGCARIGGSDAKCDELGMSGSIMHVPTGLFVTGIYGQRNDDNRKLVATLGATDDKDEFYMVMAGIEKSFSPVGKTTLFGEYMEGDYGASINSAANLNSAARSAASFGLAGNIAAVNTEMFGIGFNQNVAAAAMDIYVSYRNYSLDVTSTTGAKSNLEDIQQVITGARIQF